VGIWEGGGGEQRNLNRVMYVDEWSRFNFPTALRAFISSRDDHATDNDMKVYIYISLNAIALLL
jgi:hypothetical protein